MKPELCEPVDVTTWGDGIQGRYTCTACGLWAVEDPDPIPVCFVKGGRKTNHGQTQGSCSDHPGPCGGDTA